MYGAMERVRRARRGDNKGKEMERERKKRKR